MSLLDLPSGKVYVETSGLETGSTVICIHGLGGSSSNFYPLVEAAELGKKYKVVLFDLPGHGLSPLGGQTETKGVEVYVRCLEEVTDALKIEKAALVGHSMGCLIATTFASLYPKRVTKLCLLGPIKQFPSTPFQPLLDRASTARSSLSSFSTLSSTLSIGGTSPSSHSNHLVIAAVRTSILHTDPEGYARACEALAHATDPAYGSVEGDVLVISGHDDKTSTEQIGESLVSVLKGKREVVKGGHWMLLESVEEVAVLAKGFLID
ncbi:hypothetical protein TREMEDRAFT_65817 [Tremella mesenterica DSM 1558]|uniref:uncharacterized protein n=1 Tax=Tremella mesenterica (strain ATCC 24925 / CBS 8224 / DSM 1558 / NBRC 9311 / NRRL Y-6157 / RJB 2259-6 / UBC 559-6) TaxID=578456 RepID=UPI00032CB839|nr:uncharacterized protein TREMEDRAFT_65817 [Tremella mesenterica DSM 1558]EIW66209.1 hypothetical protein TREMEDRAFT_65817 [Tremella mesenterica DSM 1558]